MRLLHVDNNGELSLTQDLQDNLPPYAILSHTWGAEHEEVTLVDIEDGSASSRNAFSKIVFCINQAKQDGLHYVWIDTCCIDRRNLVELSEAINSMFRWYANANKCYVYLVDVPTQQSNQFEQSLEMDFRRSRWFTRGWCLQELLAPQDVDFYTWQGRHLGTRIQNSRLIQSITGIDESALLGAPLSSFSIEKRFEWASRRQTKKPEDAIYCLLGIFEVSMPLNYAEGKEKARRRLNQEIADNQRHLLETDSHAIHQSIHMTPEPDAAAVSVHHRSLFNPLLTGRLVLDVLTFGGMDSRRINIENPLEHTCSWILSHPAYRTWKSGSDMAQGTSRTTVDEQSPFLWIKGHPGAGKSTLIRYVDLNISKEIQDTPDLLLSFYFNARGSELEKSVTGMYRTLILQLCTILPRLTKVLGEMRFHEKPLHLLEHELLQSLPGLKHIFIQLVEEVQRARTYCLIDALDETDEDDVVDMIKFLRTVERSAAKQGVPMHVCLASRHYPTVIIPKSLPVILDGEAGHQQDLRVYVDTNLHISNSARATPIKEEILTKANGIFMWVVLVVDILNKEYRRGNILMVEKKLQQIPTKLSALFSDILQQGDVEPESFLLCLRLILFAAQPLTLLQLYHAMLSVQLGPEEYFKRYQDPWPSCQELLNFLITNSKGLAEAIGNQPSEHMSVQFIHKSVPDFLLEHDGLNTVQKLCKESVPRTAHEQIKQSCVHALNVWTPFSPYAFSNVFIHAESAAAALESQEEFCQFMVTSRAWYAWRDSKMENVHYSCEHLLTFTLILNHGHLRDCILDHDLGSILCSEAALDEATLYAAGEAKPDIVEMLMEAGADPDTQDVFGSTPLHYVLAMQSRRVDGETSLIQSEDAPLIALGYYDVVFASTTELEEKVCDVLIKHEADVNIQNHAGRTPLHIAVRLKEPTIAEKLLRAGANPRTTDMYGRTPYHVAMQCSHTGYFACLKDFRRW